MRSSNTKDERNIFVLIRFGTFLLEFSLLPSNSKRSSMQTSNHPSIQLIKVTHWQCFNEQLC